MFVKTLLYILISLSLSSTLFAFELQILHTNDLHSFIEHSDRSKSEGGLAAIKAIADERREMAREKGIPTLFFDAGDFSEGSIYYMADRSRSIFRVMDKMGYDAIVIGNHDYSMGIFELNNIMKEVGPKTTILGSNISLPIFPSLAPLWKHIEKYKIYNVNGKKIGVIGITSNERLYSWRLAPGQIFKPIKRANKLAKKLKNKFKVDMVIALSHVGYKKDIQLAKKSRYIDVIVGAHSHTTLREVHYERNKHGKQVPIVQVGHHGRYLGQTVVKKVNGVTTVQAYNLLPVVRTKIDEKMNNEVSKVVQALHKEYGKDWLNEEIGYTSKPLRNSDKIITFWTSLITDTIREAANADLAVHSPRFAGVNLNPGPIRRMDLYQAYPRSFEIGDRMGWKIWSVSMRGFLVKSLIKLVVKSQSAVSFSGVSYRVVKRSGRRNQLKEGDAFLGFDTKFDVQDLRINGEPIRSLDLYRVAFPEGVIKGGLNMSNLFRLALRNVNVSSMSIWEALEKKISTVDDVADIETSYNLFVRTE